MANKGPSFFNIQSKAFRFLLASIALLGAVGLLSRCGSGKKKKSNQSAGRLIEQQLGGTESITVPIAFSDQELSLVIPDPSFFPDDTAVRVYVLKDEDTSKIRFGVETILPLTRLKIDFVDPNGALVSMVKNENGAAAKALLQGGKKALAGEQNQPYLTQTATDSTSDSTGDLFLMKLNGTKLHLGRSQSSFVDYDAANKEIYALATVVEVPTLNGVNAAANLDPSGSTTYVFAPKAEELVFSIASTVKTLGAILTDDDVTHDELTESRGKAYNVSVLPADADKVALKTTAVSPLAKSVQSVDGKLRFVFDGATLSETTSQLKASLDSASADKVIGLALEVVVSTFDCSNQDSVPKFEKLAKVFPLASNDVVFDFDMSSVIDQRDGFAGDVCINYQNRLLFGWSSTAFSAEQFPYALQLSVTGFPAKITETLSLTQSMPDTVKSVCENADASLHSCLAALSSYPTVRISCADASKKNCVLKYAGQADAKIADPAIADPVEPDTEEPSVPNCTVAGTITNAQNGSALAAVSIAAAPTSGAASTSDGAGAYSIAVQCGTSTALTFSLTGYNNLTQTVNVASGSKSLNVSIVPTSFGAGAYVVTLNWGATPTDLDTYVRFSGGSDADINYSNKGNSDITASPYANLDVDDTNGFGPETVRIGKASSGSDALRYTGNIRYYVRALGSAFNTTETIVRLYKEGALLRTWTLDNTAASSSGYWHVFDLATNGTVTEVNTLVSSAPVKP